MSMRANEQPPCRSALAVSPSWEDADVVSSLAVPANAASPCPLRWNATCRSVLVGGRSRLKSRAWRADDSSMSPLTSLAATGLGLLRQAEQRLADGARTFTRAAEATATTVSEGRAATPVTDGDLVDAAVGVIYGRSAFAIGVTLIAVGRDTEKALLDVLA
jgi:hypothetical protein